MVMTLELFAAPVFFAEDDVDFESDGFAAAERTGSFGEGVLSAGLTGSFALSRGVFRPARMSANGSGSFASEESPPIAERSGSSFGSASPARILPTSSLGCAG